MFRFSETEVYQRTPVIQQRKFKTTKQWSACMHDLPESLSRLNPEKTENFREWAESGKSGLQ
jgi:hypothetical protein